MQWKAEHCANEYNRILWRILRGCTQRSTGDEKNRLILIILRPKLRTSCSWRGTDCPQQEIASAVTQLSLGLLSAEQAKTPKTQTAEAWTNKLDWFVFGNLWVQCAASGFQTVPFVRFWNPRWFGSRGTSQTFFSAGFYWHQPGSIPDEIISLNERIFIQKT